MTNKLPEQIEPLFTAIIGAPTTMASNAKLYVVALQLFVVNDSVATLAPTVDGVNVIANALVPPGAMVPLDTAEIEKDEAFVPINVNEPSESGISKLF